MSIPRHPVQRRRSNHVLGVDIGLLEQYFYYRRVTSLRGVQQWRPTLAIFGIRFCTEAVISLSIITQLLLVRRCLFAESANAERENGEDDKINIWDGLVSDGRASLSVNFRRDNTASRHNA
ncbi:uncharacterized protein PAC_10000 [Phialocephala subalpina]|uniref:Uncharacterized protein n=1 Tax=Phialocephala subalpina TaxID=576137 RepID=A0A1L7X518_9HELO|nr:uncharacterized protein PAC_10000 [Phialocephala subalpina]